MLMIFFLLKKHVSLSSAVFSAVFIGLMHELLIYAKWGTPLLFELLFLTALIFFWDLAQKNKLFYVLSGAMYPLAFLSKMSALYFAVALVLFISAEFFIRRKIIFKDLLWFVFGFLLIIIPWFLFFFLPLKSEYALFLATVGHANIGGIPHLGSNLFGLAALIF
jgi:hypothetical protein